jgi:hypothetical protein
VAVAERDHGYGCAQFGDFLYQVRFVRSDEADQSHLVVPARVRDQITYGRAAAVTDPAVR